jgi:tetratricopeptide (TPR) repeat protein
MVRGVLGLALTKSGHGERGIALCEQAVEIAGDMHRPALDYLTMTRLAYSLLLTGKFRLAEECCQRGVNACERFAPYVASEAFRLGMLGDAYIGQGRHQAGIDTLAAAMALFEEQGDRWGTALCTLKQGRAYLALSRADEAKDLLQRCLPIFRELGLPAYEDAAAEALQRCQPAPGRSVRDGRRERLAAARGVG